MQSGQINYVYHGGEHAVTRIAPHRRGENDELLCTSRSVNVAARYGKVISRFIVNDVPTKQMTVSEWLHGTPTLDDLRKEGFQAAVVAGEADRHDFPVDMLVVLDVAALMLDRTLTKTEIQALDDGLPVNHDPTRPSDRGWSIWVADLCSDVDSALRDLGWTVVPNLRYSSSVPEDEGWREYTVTVTPGFPLCYAKPYGAPLECWTIANNYGCDDGVASTKEDALKVADQWLRNEEERRRLDRESPRLITATSSSKTSRYRSSL